MKITFNQLGVITSTITNDEPLRQGNVGANTLTATFQGKNNINFTALFAYTRSDGQVITGVAMQADNSDPTKYTYLFEDPWFFAKAGTTTLSIQLINASGQAVVSGQMTFSIEQTDFSQDDPQITLSQYLELIGLITGKLDISKGIVVLNESEDISGYEDGQIFYSPDSLFYRKNNDQLEVILDLSNVQNIGIIFRTGVIDLTHGLSASQLQEALKPICFLFYNYSSNREIYVKYSGYKNGETQTYLKFEKINKDFQSVIAGTWQVTYKEFVFLGSNGNLDSKKQNTYITYDKDTVFTKDEANEKFVDFSSNYQHISGVKIFDVPPQTDQEFTYSSDREIVDKGYVDDKGDILQAEIDTINGKIPSNASSSNKLIASSEKGASSGVATLDENGKLPLSQVPDSIAAQFVRGGFIYVFSATEEDSYDPADTMVVIPSSNAIEILGLNVASSITVNGITAVGDGFISYSDFVSAVKAKGRPAEGMFLSVNGRKSQSGYISANVSPIVNKNFEIASSVSTGDWLIINKVVGNTSVVWVKLDNTDAVSSVNGKTGAVVLTGNDIEMGGENHTKLDEEINKKIDETTAQDRYQSKILHVDLFTIATTSWVLNEGEYLYTSADLYNSLGLVNTNDLVEIVGINASDRSAIAEYGIYLENVTTTDRHTYAYIRSTLKPETSINLSVVVTKQQFYDGGIDSAITDGDIGDTLKIVNSKLEVDKSKFVNAVVLDITTTKISDLMSTYGLHFTLIFKENSTLRAYYSISSKYDFGGDCTVEIEALFNKVRYSAIGISTDTTISAIMTSTYESDYALEKDTINVVTLLTTDTIQSLLDTYGADGFTFFCKIGNGTSIYALGVNLKSPGYVQIELEHTANKTRFSSTDFATSNTIGDLMDLVLGEYKDDYLTQKGGLPYLTTAPSADNTDGIKIVVLSSEPATKYNGYLYIIVEE